MEQTQFYLVIGTLFYRNYQTNIPGIGVDPYGAKDVIQNSVENTMFSGVIDMRERIGSLHDMFGNSNIKILTLAKEEAVNGFLREKLVFLKKYELRRENFYYEVFSKNQTSIAQEWFGKWKYHSDEGLVRLFTIQSRNNFADWSEVTESLSLLHLSQDKIYPKW